MARIIDGSEMNMIGARVRQLRMDRKLSPALMRNDATLLTSSSTAWPRCWACPLKVCLKHLLTKDNGQKLSYYEQTPPVPPKHTGQGTIY